MAPDVVTVLMKLGDRSQRVGDDDLVFVGDAGGYLDVSLPWSTAAATKHNMPPRRAKAGNPHAADLTAPRPGKQAPP